MPAVHLREKVIALRNSNIESTHFREGLKCWDDDFETFDEARSTRFKCHTGWLAFEVDYQKGFLNIFAEMRPNVELSYRHF